MGEGHNGGPKNKCSNVGGQVAEKEGHLSQMLRIVGELTLGYDCVRRSLVTLEKNWGIGVVQEGTDGEEVKKAIADTSAKRSVLSMGRLLKVWVGLRVLCKVGARTHTLTR